MDPKPSSDVQQWKRSNYGNIVFDSALEMSATHPNKAISIVMEQKNNHIIYPKVEPFVEILSWKSRIFIVTEKSCQHIYLKMYMISHNLLDCY